MNTKGNTQAAAYQTNKTFHTNVVMVISWLIISISPLPLVLYLLLKGCCELLKAIKLYCFFILVCDKKIRGSTGKNNNVTGTYPSSRYQIFCGHLYHSASIKMVTAAISSYPGYIISSGISLLYKIELFIRH
jgi:hypothetical protein